MSDKENGENRGFKVQDHRRFSETGEARSPATDEATGDGAPETQSEAPAATTAAETAPEANSPHEGEVTFAGFVIGLSTQALADLGEIPNPVDGQKHTDVNAARQVIDILAILQQKTAGNLDEGERGLLDSALYDLRMRYVQRARS